MQQYLAPHSIMANKKAVHIVSFSIPYPANYGGVIDVYHKLRLLKQEGVAIHLHCFQYDRQPASELERFCTSVKYYPRKGGLKALFSETPYIVASRINENLISNLSKDNTPVLFEGIHCLGNLTSNQRVTLYRESNIEHLYYRALAQADKSIWKGLYYKWEAKKLEQYESQIAMCSHILAVNSDDASYFSEKFPLSNTHYLPSFHANDEVNILAGKGNYILLHGNWLVEENLVYLYYFLKNIAPNISYSIKVAGRFIPSNILQQFQSFQNIQWISNPDENTMRALIQQAQIHFLYTAQATGLKLKLLNVLYLGRHVIVNNKMIAGTSLEPACIVANDVESQISAIHSAMQSDFEEGNIIRRAELLTNFNNQQNIQKLIKLL